MIIIDTVIGVRMVLWCFLCGVVRKVPLLSLQENKQTNKQSSRKHKPTIENIIKKGEIKVEEEMNVFMLCEGQSWIFSKWLFFPTELLRGRIAWIFHMTLWHSVGNTLSWLEDCGRGIFILYFLNEPMGNLHHADNLANKQGSLSTTMII